LVALSGACGTGVQRHPCGLANEHLERVKYSDLAALRLHATDRVETQRFASLVCFLAYAPLTDQSYWFGPVRQLSDTVVENNIYRRWPQSLDSPMGRIRQRTNAFKKKTKHPAASANGVFNSS
jgi:hypothetical protein